MSNSENAETSIIATRSRIARCSALMIGDHQRDSHSASRGITRSPYSSTSPAFESYHQGRAELPLPRVERRQPHAAFRLPLLHRVNDPVRLVVPLVRPAEDVPPRLLVL